MPTHKTKVKRVVTIKAANRPRRSSAGIAGRIQGAIGRIMANPIAMVAFGLSLALALTGTANPATELIMKVAKALQSVPALKFIGDFIASTPGQTAGAIALSIAVLTSARKSEQAVYMLGVVLFAYLIPEKSAWVYGSFAASLALFLQLRSMEDRLVLAVLALTAWVLTQSAVTTSARANQGG